MVLCVFCECVFCVAVRGRQYEPVTYTLSISHTKLPHRISCTNLEKTRQIFALFICITIFYALSLFNSFFTLS